jgi:hypothetical protein
VFCKVNFALNITHYNRGKKRIKKVKGDRLKRLKMKTDCFAFENNLFSKSLFYRLSSGRMEIDPCAPAASLLEINCARGEVL